MSLIHIIYSIFFIVFWSYVIYRHSFFKLHDIPTWWLIAGFILKVIAGITLTLIYTYYYTDRNTADIFKYFDDAKVMSAAAFTNPVDYIKMLSGIGNDNTYFDDMYYNKMNHWYRSYSSYYNDNHTVIRFNSLILFFSFGIFTIHTIIMCFLSTIGLVGFYKFFTHNEKSSNKLLLIGLFFSPSLLFWASGVLKEGLVILGLGLLMWNLKSWLTKKRLSNLVIICISVLILLATKYYVLATISPGILAWMMWSRFSKNNPLPYFALAYLFALVLFFGIGTISEKLSPANELAKKQNDFIQLSKGGIYVEITTSLRIDTIFVSGNQYNRLLKLDNGMLNIDSVKAIQYFALRKLSNIKPNIYSEIPYSSRILRDYGTTHSRLEIPIIDGSILSYLKAAPEAFLNAILQPLNPGKNPMHWLAFLENVLYLILAIYFLSQTTTLREILLSETIIFSVFFVVFLLLLTGFTTPVVGALVRYKVPALPLMIGILTFNNPRLGSPMNNIS